MKQLERLLFLQGGRCFFCKDLLDRSRASIEHLNAIANGGGSNDSNCVACCKELNAALGSLSIKEKIQVVLNQRGAFICPARQVTVIPESAVELQVLSSETSPQPVKSPSKRVARLEAPESMATKVKALLIRPTADDLEQIQASLRACKHRPKTAQSLQNWMKSHFRPAATKDYVRACMAELERVGVIRSEGERIRYNWNDQVLDDCTPEGEIPYNEFLF